MRILRTKINSQLVAVFFAVVSLFIFSSCEDEFTPKTSVEDQYVLYAVNETGYKAKGLNVIKLSRVYNIDGYDLSKYNIEPVLNADVVVTYRGREYQYCENRGRYSKEASYIDTAHDGSFFSNPGEEIKIKATLPNGKVISAKSMTLYWNYLTFSFLLSNGFTTKINHFLWGNSFDISWFSNKTNNLFIPSLKLYYSELQGGTELIKYKEIPTQFIKRNNALEPIFPSCQYGKSVSFDYNAIDSVVAGISEGISNKSKIRLCYLEVGLIEYNKDLSDYYSSIHGFTDRFSIRLDDRIYSNISGGIGIFGTSNKVIQQVYFNPEYPEMFGYKGYTDW